MNHIYNFFKQGLALFLPLIWLGIGCTANNPVSIILPSSSGTAQEQEEVNANEVVIFIGNPGVGKSSLLNSILQDTKFKSPSQPATSTLIYQQKYIQEGTMYIDTPGLDDVTKREQAAQEIEKVLKHNNTYKIIFVATIKDGRIRSKDAAIINTVCNAIKTPFEYGLIVNKVMNKTKKELALDKDLYDPTNEKLTKVLVDLDKKPGLIAFLTKDRDMEEEEKLFFLPHESNRTTLLNLILGLKPARINIGNVDISAFQQKIDAIEKQVRDHGERIKKLEENIVSLTEGVSSLSTEFQTLRLSNEKQLTQIQQDLIGLRDQWELKSEEKKQATLKKFERFKSNSDALHNAAVIGDVELMALLVDHGHSVNKKASREDEGNPGISPLARAAYSGQVAAMQFLVEHGANIHNQDKGCSPLFYAAKGGQVAALQFLLDKKANVDTRIWKEEEMNSLHVAAQSGHVDAIQCLLERKASVNMVGGANFTPLIYAARGFNIAAVQLLLDSKADVNQVEHIGLASLHLSASNGNLEITKLLLDKKANVSVKDDSGRTPLYYANESKHWMVAELLRKYGD